MPLLNYHISYLTTDIHLTVAIQIQVSLLCHHLQDMICGNIYCPSDTGCNETYVCILYIVRYQETCNQDCEDLFQVFQHYHLTKIAKICFKFSSITIIDKCNDRNAFICLAHGFYSTHNRYLRLNSIRCCNP